MSGTPLREPVGDVFSDDFRFARLGIPLSLARTRGSQGAPRSAPRAEHHAGALAIVLYVTGLAEVAKTFDCRAADRIHRLFARPADLATNDPTVKAVWAGIRSCTAPPRAFGEQAD